MAASKPAGLVLIVTGSTLRAEEVDRPLAYYLKQRAEAPPHLELDLERRGRGDRSDGGSRRGGLPMDSR